MASFRAKDMEGIFIYHDQKNRTIYYNPVLKKAYQLHDEDVGKYILLSNRWVMTAIIVLLIYYSFSIRFSIALLIGLVFLAVTTVYFYWRFIPSLPILNRFEREKRPNLLKRNAAALSSTRLLFTTVFGILLIILIFYNLSISKYTGLVLYANYALIAAILFYSAFCFYEFIQRNKGNGKSLRKIIIDDMQNSMTRKK